MGLTAKEISILKLMAKGRLRRQVADDLHITDNTVKTHLVHVYRKLHCRNRVEAIVIAMEQKII